MNVYVDLDSTLLSDELDKVYNSEGLDGYNRLDWRYGCDRLNLNYHLLIELDRLKALGHRLYVFTNRGPAQVDATVRNLGPWTYLFDGMGFYDGKKGDQRLDGWLYDNDVRYAQCVAPGQFTKVSFQG